MRISAVSNYISCLGTYLPFIVVVAFVFDKPLFWLMSVIGIDETKVSNFSFLRNQHDFLISKNLAGGPGNYDFRIFEGFIWLASALSILRVLTGIISPTVLKSFKDKYAGMKERGLSIKGAILSLLFLGPFGIYLSTHFEMAFSSDQLRLIVTHWPKVFVCSAAFGFCAAAIFSAEGVLFLAWLIFFSWRADSSASP
jgi:hypothetical protein